QRVGIARTLLHDPKVLILDEPANGLDPQARIEMRKLLLTLSDMGKTLIVTSHILPELSRICNQVAIISNGKMQAFGTLSDIMQQVQQQRTIEIQLPNATMIAQAQSAMSRFDPESESVTVSEAESIVRFRTTRDEEGLGQVLSFVVESGVPVTQFRELQTDLEDAFLSVTQQQTDSAPPAQPMADAETVV
ncbi:MAG: ABC transporter ATP-binding protein, partial [Planctomycetaceae bacterium]